MPMRFAAPAGALPTDALAGDAGGLQALAELAGVGFFRVDAARTLVAVSPQMERITGFSAADVLGKPCLTLLRCRECLKGCAVFRFGRVRGATVVLYRAVGSEAVAARLGVEAVWMQWSEAERTMPFIMTGGENASINLLVNGDPTNADFTYPFPLHWEDSFTAGSQTRMSQTVLTVGTLLRF